MKKTINNHLKNGYSDFIYKFLNKYHADISLRDSILDVGCGHMRNMIFMNNLGFDNLHGIDILEPSPGLLSFTEKCSFLQHDLHNPLPYKSSSKDVVLCNYVLMFIRPDKLEVVLDELVRVANKFILIETNKPKSTTRHSDFQNYDFDKIVNYFKSKPNAVILQERRYYEKLLIKINT